MSSDHGPDQRSRSHPAGGEEDDEGWLYRIPPPPEATYRSFADMSASVSSWCQVHGLQLVRGSLQDGRTTEVRCGRSRQPRTGPIAEKRAKKRRRASSETGCTMKLLCLKNASKSWSIKHMKRDGSFFHNHEPMDSGSLTADSHGNIEREDLQAMIESHVRSGVTSTVSLQTCKTTHPALSRSVRHIEEVKTIFKDTVQDAGVLTASLAMLRRANCFLETKNNRHNRAESIFCAFPKLIKIFKRNSDVILLDSVYRAPACDKPWLNIFGMNGDRKTFHLATCLMEHNGYEDYVWALRKLVKLLKHHSIAAPRLIILDKDSSLRRAARLVFPNVHHRLCMWHLEKEAVAFCRAYTKKAREISKQSSIVNGLTHRNFTLYQRLSSSASKVEYQRNLLALKTQWPTGYQFLEEIWLREWKELSIAMWTDRQITFGIHAISRDQGAHLKLTSMLGPSPLDLYNLFERLLSFWIAHAKEIVYHRHCCKTDKPVLSSFMLAKLQAKIWPSAMVMAKTLIEYAAEKFAQELSGREIILTVPCGCKDMKTIGMPCQHTVLKRYRAGESLKLEDFDSYWHISRQSKIEAESSTPSRSSCRRARTTPSQRVGRMFAQRLATLAGNTLHILASRHD